MDSLGKRRTKVNVSSLWPKRTLWFLTLFLAAFLERQAGADLLHLKSGGVVDIGWDYRMSGDKVIIKKQEGYIAIPLSDVIRIEKTERKSLPQPPVGAKIEKPEEDTGSASPEVVGGGDSAKLVSLVEEVLAYLGRANRSSELSEEDREEGLSLIKTWMDEARDIVATTRETAIRDVAEDLLTELETLDRELGDGRLSSGPKIEGSLREMLQRL